MFVLLFGVFGQANAQPEVLKDCIRIRQDFTLKISLSATNKNDATFASGAIVAGKKIETAGPSCKDNDGKEIAVGTLCKATVAKNTACYLFSSKEYGLVGMFNTIYNVTSWVFYIMTLVAIVMIVFGGFTYITAAGDPAKAGKGKSILTYAIIGLAIALVAKLIPSLVRFILRV